MSGMPVEDAAMGLWRFWACRPSSQVDSWICVMEHLLATEPLIDGVIALFNELSMEVPE
ncbi:MAG: hypothetical protein KF817_04005 [Phycisphaeraceae bacterium]|nr:hypothetical protein [Phycisphaeraceae bacterium]